MSKGRIIYYYPAPILENANSASGIRPRKMLEAFKALGYDVDVVSGYNEERKKCMEQIKKNVQNGVKYDFAYGEATTQPFVFNDPKHFPLHLLMDYAFWHWMKRNKIPFGCFYRDMYWCFPEFKSNQPSYKRLAHQLFHNVDIRLLKRYCTRIYMPTLECAEDLPVDFRLGQIVSLPPGGDLIEINDNLLKKTPEINLLYVGGCLPPAYDLSPAINFVATTGYPVHLTICCREDEFAIVKKDSLYPNIISDKIDVIQKNGNELKEYWQKADLFFVMREKTRYLNKAMPFKIFEAISNAVPIITTKGTIAAKLVEEEGFGWGIKTTQGELEKLFDMIIKNQELVIEKKELLLKNRYKHTWKMRAEYVVKTLQGE